MSTPPLTPAVTPEAEEVTPQLTEITDAHLRTAMFRAMRLVGILSIVIFLILLPTAGWQTAMLLLVGALISVSGLWEWQKLIGLIQRKLDNQQKAGSARVIVGFFVRLLVGAAILYGSLRCFHGSVYALLGGLALAALALAIEASRLIRS